MVCNTILKCLSHDDSCLLGNILYNQNWLLDCNSYLFVSAISLLNMALEDGCSGLNTLLKCLTDLVLFGTCLLQSSFYKHFLLDTKSDTSHKNNYNETNE